MPKVGMMVTAVLALAGVFLGPPAHAKGQGEPAAIYDCHVSMGQKDWIGERYIFVQETEGEAYDVMDAFIQYFHDKKPVTAKTIKDTPKHLVLEWRLDAMDGSGNRARLFYHATLFRADDLFLIEGRVPGYVDAWSGRGNCRKVTAAELNASP